MSQAETAQNGHTQVAPPWRTEADRLDTSARRAFCSLPPFIGLSVCHNQEPFPILPELPRCTQIMGRGGPLQTSESFPSIPPLVRPKSDRSSTLSQTPNSSLTGVYPEIRQIRPTAFLALFEGKYRTGD